MDRGDNKLHEVLEQHFGHTAFRPLQQEIIESALSGTPTLAILPTGGGKSLTYQLPSFLLDGVTLVISPLLSLIEDQVTTLLEKNISAARYDSTLSKTQRTKNLDLLREGAIQIFYTSPESLSNKEFLAVLKSIEIGLVAIDEAHCITEWGHSFRPSYLFLPKIVRSIKPQCILALTATATRKTASEIRKRFRIKTAHQWSASNLRENLNFQVIPCLAEEKSALLLNTLQEQKNLPAIVYVMRQIDCESVAHFLSEQGISARAYHAGMSTESRQKVQEAFLKDKVEVIIATIAFGMGVDKPNIRTVVHYHLPKSPENWMQESGRAGRDGKPSICLSLACGDDLIPLENFIEAKVVRKSVLTNLLTSLTQQGRKISFSPYHTRLQHDIHASTFDILLAQLELSNKVKFQNTSWRYIRAWIVPGKQLDLSSYPKKTQHALEHILNLGERYDSFQSEQDWGIKKEKLWHIVEELYQQQDIVLIRKGWLWNYQIPADIEVINLTKQISETFSKQTQTDRDKLEAVEKITTSKRCIPRALAEWLGEKDLDNCGKCSSCLKIKRPRKLPRTEHSVSDADIEKLRDLLEDLPNKFQTNQQLTRFLCGIPSPYLRHHRLTSHKDFGYLSYLPYSEIFAFAKACLNAED